MKEPSFSVAEAAEQAGTSVSSIRRWIAEFAPRFSPGAKPEKGVFRRLSSQDIQVLQEIARLKEDNLSTSTINERLDGLVFQAPIVESPHAAQESRSEAMVPAIVLEHLERIETRFQYFEERVDAIEDRNDTVIVALSAFIAGLILGLAVWWFQ